MDTCPRYRQVADALRRSILAGDLPPGARLPSRARIAVIHEVSEQVSRHALRLLVSEGLLESRPGAGYFVRTRPRQHRIPRTERTTGLGSSLSRVQNLGTATTTANDSLAERLGVRAGTELYRSLSLGWGEGGEAPVMLHTSWEPVSLTIGTSWPPDAERLRYGLLDRLAAVGVSVNRVLEQVGVLTLREPEASMLQLSVGNPVMVIERTHYSRQRPVETSYTLASPECCQLVYRLSVSRPG